MKTKQHILTLLCSSTAILLLSACGPGQLLGPTLTPTSTPTLTPTITPTNTPTSTPTSTPTATPTATPTFTPSPTVTNTPTPTATATSTPTRLPPACIGKNGKWSGSGVSFTVSKCIISNLTLGLALSDGRYSFLFFPYLGGTLSIKNNRFSFRDSEKSISGAFNSPTQAGGSWTVIVDGQSFSGDWSASPQ